MYNMPFGRFVRSNSRLAWTSAIVAALLVPVFIAMPNGIAASSFQMPLGPIDASKFVHFRSATVPGLDIDESVDLIPYHTSSVTKIGYGNVKSVRIISTSTGVYSSDALTSPYVNYPGIERIDIPVLIHSNGSITYLNTSGGGLVDRLVRLSNKAKSIVNSPAMPFNGESFTMFNK